MKPILIALLFILAAPLVVLGLCVVTLYFKNEIE
jgi:hypothetical protein